jgi:hypothetical protein
MASSTLPDEQDPQSPMAVMTTAQRRTLRVLVATGALALVLPPHDLADPVALARDLRDAIGDAMPFDLPLARRPTVAPARAMGRGAAEAAAGDAARKVGSRMRIMTEPPW